MEQMHRPKTPGVLLGNVVMFFLYNIFICTQAPVDTDVGESSALSATRFSQTLSSTKKSENKTGTTQDAIATKTSCSRTAGSDEGSCCGEGDGSCQSIKTR